VAFRRVNTMIDPPRRKRPSRRCSKVSKVDLKRAIDGAQRVGLEISAVDIRPDGTITIRTGCSPLEQPNGVFEKWEDRL
jgi:hypothetical protein